MKDDDAVSMASTHDRGDTYICPPRFLVKRHLGGGSFGEVYLAYDNDTDDYVAIKVDKDPGPNSQIANEYHVLKALKHPKLHVPAVVFYGMDGHTGILAMTRMGKSVQDLYERMDCRFSLKTVLMLAEQMITRVEFIHHHGFVHRDLKPENFCVGWSDNRIHAIDFGLARRYRDRKGHVELVTGKGMVGTVRYASINAHDGFTQSRRDDIESLAYILIFLARRSLPWQGIRCQNSRDKYEKVGYMKRCTPPATLCKGLPRCFSNHLTIAHAMRFEEEPDYHTLRELYRGAFSEHGFVRDRYDWQT